MLSSDDAIQVVGEASNGRAAVESVRTLRPEVVLMDVRMPDLDGISATREVLAVSPDVKRILMKLRLRDRVQAVIFAYESGLTKPGARTDA